MRRVNMLDGSSMCVILIFVLLRITITLRPQILWWATRLTFNSYRVLRHMSRLFAAGSDPELAKRTLRLYATVVGKAREAGEEADSDTDENWVMTLVAGARLLCKLASTLR